MSGDYFSHTDRKYDEIIERLEALEKKVANSKLMMKRTLDGEYEKLVDVVVEHDRTCLLYTSPSPRDRQKSRMPSSA